MKPTVIHDDGSEPVAGQPFSGPTPAPSGNGHDDAENRTERRNRERCTQSVLQIAHATETFATLGYSFYDAGSVMGVLRAVESSRDHLSALADGLRARQSLLTQQGL